VTDNLALFGCSIMTCYLLKQILHDWNDDQCRTILANCARRLVGGGRIYIIEMVIPDDNSPSFASLMDLYMMVMLPGRERALQEYQLLLDTSGLKFERVLPTHSPSHARANVHGRLRTPANWWARSDSNRGPRDSL